MIAFRSEEFPIVASSAFEPTPGKPRPKKETSVITSRPALETSLKRFGVAFSRKIDLRGKIPLNRTCAHSCTPAHVFLTDKGEEGCACAGARPSAPLVAPWPYERTGLRFNCAAVINA